MAVRDEIVEMVLAGKKEHKKKEEIKVAAAPLPIPGTKDVYEMVPPVEEEDEELDSPRTGVEIVSVAKRGGENYYEVRDLRNGNVVKNVTLKSSRRLWHYAISQYSKLPKDLNQLDIEWKGDLGLLSSKKRGNFNSYDLIERTKDGHRFYYGVTDDGIHGRWEVLV